MARDVEMRRRTMRLLDGDFRPDDVSRLFLWLRERSHGLASIREIGDFVAHSDTRKKGVVTEETRDFLKYLSLRLPNCSRRVDLSDLPSDFECTGRG
jgi:hypothetical protein